MFEVCFSTLGMMILDDTWGYNGIAAGWVEPRRSCDGLIDCLNDKQSQDKDRFY